MADRPLRVLHLVQQPQRRGAEVFARDLADAQAARGCAVRSVYLYDHEGARLDLADGDVVLGGDPMHPVERTLAVNPSLLRRLRAVVREFGPDIVQANGGRTLKYAALARWGCPWKLVYRNIGEPSSWLILRRHRLLYQRIVMPRVDAVVGVSARTLDDVRKTYGFTRPMRHIPRAVDPTRFRAERPVTEVRRALATAVGATVLVYVGSLSPEKRPDRLARVFARVHAARDDAVLWVVGDGPAAAGLRAELEGAGVTGSARLLGARADVADLVNAADVLVLTSDTEGLPGVVLEAAVLGVPAVATDVGGVAECVRDGETGVLVAADDEAGLAGALLRLAGDPAGRRVMGRCAQEWVGERYDFDRVVSEYLDFYAEVLGGHDLTPSPEPRPN